MRTEQDEINMLREHLDYNPDTGVFRWKQARGHMVKGSIAGTIANTGYRRLHVFRKQYSAHRVAFAFIHNRWPKPVCDHINGDSLDNRIFNLREATTAGNSQNCRKPKNNTSGIKGVSWHKKDKRWQAQIRVNYKPYYCGNFKTLEEAALAVAQKRQELHGEFARD
jgi:hypothetical protein